MTRKDLVEIFRDHFDEGLFDYRRLFEALVNRMGQSEFADFLEKSADMADWRYMLEKDEED